MTAAPDSNHALPAVKPKLEVLSFDEFSARIDAREARGWRWKGILPASGIMLLVGLPYHGKSTLVAALVGAMSCRGKPELAGRRVMRGKAIIASLEHGGRSLIHTLKAAACGMGAQKPRVQIVPRLDLDDPEQVDELLAEARLVDARVIVIDPFRGSTRLDENSAADVRCFGEVLRRLTDDGCRLVILIHHLGKTGNMPRGSTDFLAVADGWIHVSKKKGDITLDVTHHSAPNVKIKLRVLWDDDKLTLDEIATGSSEPETSQAEDDALMEAIVEIVTASPGATMRKIRSSVRARKIVNAGHDAIDAAVRQLAVDKTIENRGSASRHAWHPGTDRST